MKELCFEASLGDIREILTKIEKIREFSINLRFIPKFAKIGDQVLEFFNQGMNSKEISEADNLLEWNFVFGETSKMCGHDPDYVCYFKNLKENRIDKTVDIYYP